MQNNFRKAIQKLVNSIFNSRDRLMHEQAQCTQAHVSIIYEWFLGHLNALIKVPLTLCPHLF